MSNNEIIPEGTEVSFISEGRTVTGVVSDYVTSEQAEDGKAFYYVDAEGGMNNFYPLASEVTPGRSVAELQNRTLPDPTEFLKSLNIESDEFTIGGFDLQDGAITLYSETPEGLMFVAHLEVRYMEVYEA